MTSKRPHICVCICTYKRPELLRVALHALAGQDTGGLFTYSALVVDNDSAESARAVAGSAEAIEVKYCVQPRQGIAVARNTGIANARGEYVAFLDDDEYPIREWLQVLFETLGRHGADGALGPVKPYFDESAPRWVMKGKFYVRPTYPTGFVIDWKKGRTGNVLLKSDLFTGETEPFREQFRVGEDQDFFRRMIERGHVFVWCDEAAAYEFVPAVRCKRTFLWRRALLRGASSFLHPTLGPRDIARSVIAVPAYLAVLPLSLIAGHCTFMTYSVKLLDHLGRLMASIGIQPIKDAYVTE